MGLFRRAIALPVTSYGYRPPPEATARGWRCHASGCGTGEDVPPRRWPFACTLCEAPADPELDEPWAHDAKRLWLQRELTAAEPGLHSFWQGQLISWQFRDAVRRQSLTDAQQVQADGRRWLGQQPGCSRVTAGSLHFQIVEGALSREWLDLAADELAHWSRQVRVEDVEQDNDRRTDCRGLLSSLLGFLEHPSGGTHPQAGALCSAAAGLRDARVRRVGACRGPWTWWRPRMISVRSHRRAFPAWRTSGLVFVLLVLSGCTATTHGSPAAANPAPASPAPAAVTPSEVAEPPPAAPGQLILDPDAIMQACNEVSEYRGGRRYVTLAATGLALVECPVGSWASTETELVGIDLRRHATRWHLRLPANATYRVGRSAVYLLQEASTEAGGLVDAELSYTMSALDLTTAAPRWSVPIEAWLPAKQRGIRATGDSQFRIAEGPSGQPGVDHVVVTLNGTTALGVDRGAELWHTSRTYLTLATGSYTTAGIVEVNGRQDNRYDTHRTGIDPRTDQVVWDLRLPEPESAVSSTQTLIGTQQWVYRDTGFVVYDVPTGRIVRSAQLPEGWTRVSVSPGGVLAIVDGRLQFSRLDAPASPVWSVPASENSRVVLTGTGHALIEVPAGYAVVSLTDGSVVGEFPPDEVNGQPVLVDGTVVLGDGDRVIQLDEPASN